MITIFFFLHCFWGGGGVSKKWNARHSIFVKKKSGHVYTSPTEGPFDELQGPLVTQVLMLYGRKEGSSKFASCLSKQLHIIT
jgi:hypothetical protein